MISVIKAFLSHFAAIFFIWKVSMMFLANHIFRCFKKPWVIEYTDIDTLTVFPVGKTIFWQNEMFYVY